MVCYSKRSRREREKAFIRHSNVPHAFKTPPTQIRLTRPTDIRRRRSEARVWPYWRPFVLDKSAILMRGIRHFAKKNNKSRRVSLTKASCGRHFTPPPVRHILLTKKASRLIHSAQRTEYLSVKSIHICWLVLSHSALTIYSIASDIS